ncbi:MAG: helix-hairpin-helix domain-containing protein [Planctomycetes bacterium]|nr:helix-hairpin-helix domain-containing protein [Planctomycetota bacterium]
MKKFPGYAFTRIPRRGSALVMAILITMLLFLIGLGFISKMLTDKASVARIDDQAILDNAVDSVVDDIQQVLTGDLFRGGSFLDGNAAYDYPDSRNRWLASLEPEYYNDGITEYYYWPHITDLWNNFGPYDNGDLDGDINNFRFSFYYDPDDYTTANQANFNYFNPLARHYLVNNPDILPYSLTNITRNPGTICRIVGENEHIDDAWLNSNEEAPWGTAYDQLPFINLLVTHWNTLIPGLGLLPTDPIFNTSALPPAWLGQNRPYPTLSISGMRADADGDGVADSRWVRRYRIDQNGPWDHAIYTAVRIIDNGGMINLNTAHKANDGRITSVNGWTTSAGNLLSDINLVDHAFNKGDPPWALHDIRCGGDGSLVGDIDYLRYQNFVSMSINNPDPMKVLPYFPAPFDISDELELRNRFFMYSPVTSRTGLAWPITLNPQADPGRAVPFGAYGADTVLNWFNKANSLFAPNASNTRHFVTAYNFDRAARPATVADILAQGAGFTKKVGIVKPAWEATADFITRLSNAIFQGLPDDAKIQARFGDTGNHTYSQEELAWQYAVNLHDYQDVDAPPPVPPYTYHETLINGGAGQVEFFGVEPDYLLNDSIMISEVAYYNNAGVWTTAPLGKYYAVELTNPDPANPKDLDQPANVYKLWIGKGSNPLVLDLDGLGINLALNGDAADDDSIVLMHAVDNSGGSIDVSGVALGALQAMFPSLNGPPIRLDKMAFDLIGVNAGLNEPNEIKLVKELDYGASVIKYMPVDFIEVPNIYNGGLTDVLGIQERNTEMTDVPGANSYLLFNHLWGNGGTLGVRPAIANSIPMQIFTPPPPLPHLFPLNTIGEIPKVFAVGSSYNITTGECHTLCEGVGKAYEMDPDDFDGLNSFRSLRSWGRINLRDKAYWDLLDYLTYLDPSGDGLDNNGNGFVDQLDPIEQAVPGRININTAPWYVIAQLPWITPDLAHAIVGFRDKKNLELLPIYGIGSGVPNYTLGRGIATTGAASGNINENRGFRNIAELMQVVVPDPNHPIPPSASVYVKNTDLRLFDIRQRRYDKDGATGELYPRNTALDNPAINDDAIRGDFSADSLGEDFEERDLIFQRISNLVTVRSDVFTAYILVRIGRDGPQKRMIAIFDRSNVFTPMDKPKLVALHPVPDPR